MTSRINWTQREIRGRGGHSAGIPQLKSPPILQAADWQMQTIADHGSMEISDDWCPLQKLAHQVKVQDISTTGFTTVAELVIVQAYIAV